MYVQEYDRWLAFNLEDPDLLPELLPPEWIPQEPLPPEWILPPLLMQEQPRSPPALPGKRTNRCRSRRAWRRSSPPPET